MQSVLYCLSYVGLPLLFCIESRVLNVQLVSRDSCVCVVVTHVLSLMLVWLLSCSPVVQ